MMFWKSFCPVFLLVINSSIAFTQSSVVGYSYPAGWPRSEHYQVWANGEQMFVNQAPTAAYTAFDLGGAATIRIKANQDVKWVDIRPLSSGVRAVIKPDSTITLTISKPCQLSVELNGKITMPLYIFANPPEINKPSKSATDVLFFEAGKVHDIGVLQVESNKMVYVEGGAVVKGAIHAANGSDIKLRGRGILDGTDNVKDKSRYRHFVQFRDCRNVEVRDVILHNGTTWQIVPLHSDSVMIDNIKIISDNASDDGVDIARSTNVTLQNSFIRTKDDNIAIKANFDYPESEIVNNITVRNCVLWNALWGNAIEIGFELRAAEVKNIRITDCDIIHVEAGAAISIHNADKSTVRDVLFENIRIEDARHKLFDFAILLSQYSIDGPKTKEERQQRYLRGAWDGVTHVPDSAKKYHAQYRGHIKNVVLKDISIVDGPFPFSIFYGFDAGHLVSDVTIQNLRVHGRKITRKADAKMYEENTERIIVR
jgi:hypothetical protein